MNQKVQARKPIALLTDFGTRDAYVAAMKGVILSMHPDALVVDVSHEIPSQDTADAAFVLNSVYRYFPGGTVFVVVVDPGVGSERRIIGVRKGEKIFIAPDNGVLEFIFRDEPDAVYHIHEKTFFSQNISPTFHGRDIFAPVAAHVALGVPLKDMGEEITDFRRLRWAETVRTENGIEGSVVHCDRFGNLITCIKKSDLNIDFSKARISFKGVLLTGIQSHYAAARQGDPLALIESGGFLEIAVRGGNAKEFFRPEPDDKVVVST